MSAPELVPLATIVAGLGEQVVVKGGPMGTRVIQEVETLEISGERLTASMAGKSAADWVTIAPDRSYGVLDVRFTIETDDEAVIYVEYSGRIDFSTGRIVTAPLFQTSAENYDWLNRMQAVAVGQMGDGSLTYEVFEVVGNIA